MRPRAVVLGTELPRATAVIRSLGRAGIPVVAIDHRLRMPGAYSRYVCKSYLRRHVRDLTRTKQSATGDWPFSSSEALAVLEEVGSSGGGVLIPTNDEYLQVVARNHARLSELFTVTCPPWEVLEPLMDKVRSYRLAEQAGLRVPGYFAPESIDEVGAIACRLDFASRAYVLKLDVWSPGPTDPRSNAFTRPAGSDAAALVERCRDVLTRVGRLPIIQEVVPGGAERCIGVTMVVDRDHQPVLRYCTRRLKLYPYAQTGLTEKHPYELGANIYSESVHDEEAMAGATALARLARWSGVITVEFRRDADDGRLKFIKADLRVVNATSLSTALGLDVPTALYDVFTGRPRQREPSYRDGVAWIWIERYVRTLFANRRNREVRRQLLATLLNAHRFRAFGFLSWRDPGPLFRAWQQERARTRPPKSRGSTPARRVSA